MAPFPEDEIMTIKRLEVALRKSDFKLLKEGAYKLHEKYHSRFHFEHLDLLKEILDEVQANYAVPSDVKDILIPTIQDIISNNQNEGINRVSSLTSLSYGINNQTEKVNEYTPEVQKSTGLNQQFNISEEYPKPFQEFTPIQPIEITSDDTYQKEEPQLREDVKSIVETYNQQPIEDFDTGIPIIHQQNLFENNIEQEPIEYLNNKENMIENNQQTEEVAKSYLDKYQDENNEPKIIFEEKQEAIKQMPQPYFDSKEASNEIAEENSSAKEDNEPIEKIEEPKENIEELPKETIEEKEENTEKTNDEIVEEPFEEIPKQKTIAIFFGQDSTIEKIKNILRYKELMNSKGNFSLNEITALINELKTQSDTNVSEIQTFLEQIKSKNHKVNLITNSQSANFIDLFNQSNITYGIFNNSESEDKKINFMPIFGLTNLYKCDVCENEFLEQNEKLNSFVLQCPKCKGAMLPDMYTSRGQINMDYYNSALIALANADTWLLIHPPLNEKLTFSLINSASKVSSKLKEVYILDKDINTRETYRKITQEANPDTKVSNSLNAIEDFLNNI